MRHVVPDGETTHRGGTDCWCRPVVVDGICVHTPHAIAADRRRVAKQLAEIDAAQRAHAEAVAFLLASDRDTIQDAVNALRARGMLSAVKPLPSRIECWSRWTVLLVAEEARAKVKA